MGSVVATVVILVALLLIGVVGAVVDRHRAKTCPNCGHRNVMPVTFQACLICRHREYEQY